MTEALRHRGPDGAGHESGRIGSEPRVHLGHRRLVVIDREGGIQPMRSSDGRWLLTYNGEIYNFADVRVELESHGHRFRTSSDTEVLVEALARWGEEALARLDGMFAFAAFDLRSASLLLAVDRFGQKPLVWSMLRSGHVVFASELGSLRCHPEVSRGWDPLALCRTLVFDAPPAPSTILNGVQRLAPGSLLAARLDADGRVSDHRVRGWSALPRSGDRQAPDPEEVVAALADGVRSHLVADVPLGVLLSGGIDSTAVAILARRERPITTLCMGSSEPEYDEGTLAATTARALSSDHHFFQLEEREAGATLDAVMRHLDEPLADAGCLPAWSLYRAARSVVTVAVGGDGGDEMLEGYPTFRALEIARALDHLRAPAVWRGGAAVARRAPIGDGYYPLGYQARRFLAGMALSPGQRLLAYTGSMDPAAVRRTVRPEVLAAAGLDGTPSAMTEHLLAPAAADGTLAAVDVDVRAHLLHYLAGEVLRKVDRMSMAHGLEVRAPMLARRFADLCLAAPSSARRRGRVGKRPLRAWLAGTPGRHVLRRPKRGFALPVARWLRGELRDVAGEALTAPDSPLREWFLPDAVAALWRGHQQGRDARKELWALLTIALWMRHHAAVPVAPS